MIVESKFNHNGEPTIILFPETDEDKDILLTMHGKYTKDDGCHQLVMGRMEINGVLDSVTFTVNPMGHPTTIGRGSNQ